MTIHSARSKYLAGVEKQTASGRLRTAQAINHCARTAHPKFALGGVSELKIDIAPGYRVYCTRLGLTVVLSLFGGDKSTQKVNIKRAQQMVREL